MIGYDSFLVDGMWLSTESDLLVIADAVMCVNYADPGTADPRPKRGSKTCRPAGRTTAKV